MSENQEPKRETGEISRREFFKDAGLIIGGAAVSSTALIAAAPAPQTTTTPTPAPTAPQWSFLKPPDPIPDAKIKETITADVVVLGGGMVGLCAALAAAEKGVSVAVVERRTEKDWTHGGSDFGSVNSKLAKSKGCPDVDPVEFALEFMKQSGNRANPYLVRQYAERGGDTLDWLIKDVSKDILDQVEIFMNPFGKGYNGELGGYRTWRGTAAFRSFEKKTTIWPDAMKQVIARSIKSGAKWYYGLQAEQLVKTGNAVTGALAKDADGNYKKFVAKKGVLLALGDFSANDEMCRAYLPELSDAWATGIKKGPGIPGMAAYEGWGHRMGIWAGGQMEIGPHATMGGGASAGGPLGGTFPQFNKLGKRFCNEAANGSRGTGSQGMRQPKGMLVAVYDSQWREYMEYMPADHGMVDISNKRQMKMVEDSMAALKSGPEGGLVISTVPYQLSGAKVIKADTLEQLADYVGYKDAAKTTFLAEVKRYNEMAKAGKDTDFGKPAKVLWAIDKPPFYASVGSNLAVGVGLVTLTGLKINNDQQVVDIEDNPIPGLYAAGNCSGGRYQIQYCTPVAGSSVGIACTLGRIAGETIAAVKA